MSSVVRAALVQAEWTGDVESMIDKQSRYARQAADDGAQILCFQEIFSTPYFCAVQEREHFAYAEPMPGPTTERMAALAKETEMVLIVPMFEMVDEGTYYNTALVIDSDGQDGSLESYVSDSDRDRLSLLLVDEFIGEPAVTDRYSRLGLG